jgi:hypothetical protein
MYQGVQDHLSGRWSELLGSSGDTVHITAGERLFPSGEAPHLAAATAGIVRVFTWTAVDVRPRFATLERVT